MKNIPEETESEVEETEMGLLSGGRGPRKSPMFAPALGFRNLLSAPREERQHQPPTPKDYISAPMKDFGLLADDDSASSTEGGTSKPSLPHHTDGRTGGGGGGSRARRRSSRSVPAFRRYPSDGCFVVADPDIFLLRVYLFFAGKGLVPILTQRIVNLITLAFTVLLTTFLVGFVKWDLLAKCHDEHSCLDLPKYVTTSAVTHPNLYQRLVFLYAFLFGCYWIHELLGFLSSIKNLMGMNCFYRDYLQVSHKEIISIEWNEIVTRLLAIQKDGRYRFATGPADMNAHDIACRIMRKENYLIAMVNKDILDLSVPLPFIGPKDRGTVYARTDSFYLTRTLEWSIYHCVLNHMFSNKFSIRKEFQENVAALERRFILTGIGHVVFLPFVLFFMVTMFFLKNAQEWHADGSYLGPREWSPYAKWRFREFNELPHFFERRLNRSYKHANDYTSGFQSPLTQVLARCTRFLSGSLLSVLLVLTLIDDSVALHIKFYDHNLLWYIGVFGGLFAASSSMVKTPESRAYEPEETMFKIATYTHYFPDGWRENCHMLTVREEFSTLYPHKIHLFALEILSLVFAPLILCFSLPKCASRIIDFVREHTSDIDVIGAVCDYSLFDFAKYGDTNYAARKGAKPAEASKHGKMEKSFINFKTNHPSWDCSESGRELIENLEHFQRSYSAASMSRLDSIQEESPSPQPEQSLRLPKTREESASSVDTETDGDEDPAFAVGRSVNVNHHPLNQTLYHPNFQHHPLNQSLYNPNSQHHPLQSIRPGQCVQNNRSQTLLQSSSRTLAATVYPSSGQHQISRSILHQSFLGPDIDISILRNVLGEQQATDVMSNSFYWMEQYRASHDYYNQDSNNNNRGDEILDEFHTAYV